MTDAQKAPERIWAFYAPEIEEDNPQCDIVAGDCPMPYAEIYVHNDLHQSLTAERDSTNEAARQAHILVNERDARIDALAAENERLREDLGWYGEQARLARLIHSGGDAGRHALQNDGGRRARAALEEGKDG